MTLPQTMQAARLRVHWEILSTSVALASLLGSVTLAAMWDTRPHGHLLLWAMALAVALTLRYWTGWAYNQRCRESHPEGPLGFAEGRLWLVRHRMCFFLHGLVWGGASVWLQDSSGVASFSLLTIAVIAIAAGSLNSTTFDLKAALVFVFAALAPMMLVTVFQGDRSATVPGFAIIGFMVATFIGAKRAEKSFIESETLRLAESEKANEARALAKQAERSSSLLADQVKLQTQLLETTQQGFWFIDNDAITTDLNPAMCKLMGRTREDALRRPVKDFLGSNDLALMQEQLNARKLGELGNYEVSIVRPDGSEVFCLCNATPLYDSTGKRIGSVGIWTDLTARRETELSLKTYELVANSINDVVSVIGEDMVYRMVNDAWCDLRGLARESALNRKIEDVLPRNKSTDERRAALQACIREHSVKVVRSKIDFPDRPGRHMETTYYPYKDTISAHTVRCVVMVSRDVTAEELHRHQLEESEQYLQRTLNATGDAIFASEANNPFEKVRFANEQMLDMWGISREMIGTLTPDAIMSYAMPLFADPQGETQRVAEVIAQNVSHESKVRLRDGRVLLRRCIPSKIGTQVLRVWSFRDITELETALAAVKAKEAGYRALLDAFPGYITQLDEHMTYTYVNESVARRMGKTREQMIGHTLREVVGPEVEAWLNLHVARLHAGERVTYERHHDGQFGEESFDQVTLVKGQNWRNDGWVIYAFGIDITERKRAEQALAATSEQLRNRSEELQATLENVREAEAAIIAARDAAESASRAKSDFLSHMSHELRTPMNAILGFGQLLELEHQSESDRKDWGREVVKGGRHLLTLINEVLDLARVESGKMPINLQTLCVLPVIEDCLTLVRPQAGVRAIKMSACAIPNDLWVVADPIRLKQIVLNLLSNAIKYNVIGGTVTIVCEPHPSDPQGVARISVSDTGSGLTAAQITRLFQPFERLNADVEHIEGSGIGLVLTRRLVELLQGEIGVDSIKEKGSTFWFTLPRVMSAVGDT